MTAKPQRLRDISPSEIRPNPENPRIVFRQEEMESLLRSIDEHGVQVPITVYEEDGGYRLLDGERRWKCAQKLNLRTIPAIIKEKPSALDNLVIMYNIHALREQWDYFTIAASLGRIIDLFYQEKHWHPNEIELSALTGLTRGAIRRCQLILGLPEEYKSMLLEELAKPKSAQRLSEDLFIEMEKSLRAVTRRMPSYAGQIEKVRSVLVEKFQSGVISAVTDFRQLSKIATATDNLGLSRARATKALDRVFDPENQVGIRQAYNDTVAFQYEERKAHQQASALLAFLTDLVERDDVDHLDDSLREELSRLLDVLSETLGVAG